jgi:hypothetical protein
MPRDLARDNLANVCRLCRKRAQPRACRPFGACSDFRSFQPGIRTLYVRGDSGRRAIVRCCRGRIWLFSSGKLCTLCMLSGILSLLRDAFVD